MASVELYFGEQELGKYKLVKEVSTVGRDPTADIMIDNLGISRFHCRYINRDNVLMVEDMDSSNGTFVNGKKIVSHNLNEGDEVTIGKYRMIFHYHADEGQAADGGAEAESPGTGTMPDTLKTYVMDGQAVREQLKQLESQKQEAASGGEVSAADYAAMMDPLKPRGQGATQRVHRKDTSNLKTLLIVGIIANLLLFILLVLGLAILVWKLQAFSASGNDGRRQPSPAVEETSEQEDEPDLDSLLTP